MKSFLEPVRWRLASSSVLCIALFGGFVALYSGVLGEPRQSSADPTGQGRIRLHRPAVAKPHTADPSMHDGPSRGLLLGELIGTEYRVRITSSPDGPRYTILSLDGSVLLEDATLEEADAAFPDLGLLNLSGGPDGDVIVGPLMLADPEK